MRCRKVEKNLSAYLDRELKPQTAEKLEAHLAACPRCRGRRAALEGVEKVLRDFPAREPSPFLWTRVKANLGSEVRPARLRPTAVGARAALVSVLVAAVLAGAIFTVRREAVQPAVAGVELTVAENLDLLENYELIKNLDLLEGWEEES